MWLILVISLVVWALPCALLYPVARFEADWNGPWLRIHAPICAAYIPWSVYDALFVQHYMHGPNATWLSLPSLLGLAVFYLVIFPRVAPAMPKRMRIFSRLAAAVAVGAFTASLMCYQAFAWRS